MESLTEKQPVTAPATTRYELREVATQTRPVIIDRTDEREVGVEEALVGLMNDVASLKKHLVG